jgi:hypothetical protein
MTIIRDAAVQARAHVLAAVEIFDTQQQKATRANAVQDLHEGDVCVTIRLNKSTARFFAHLPDGREVRADSFEKLKNGVIQLLRDACVVAWEPVILVEPLRYDCFGGPKVYQLSAKDAAAAISSGKMPEGVGACAGLDVTRLYIGSRPGKNGTEWRKLGWDYRDADADWALMRWSQEFSGPLPGQIAYLPGTPQQLVHRSCVPYTEERWNELQALADKLRWLQAHVMALFHVEEGNMLITERLLSGQPITGSSRLLAASPADEPEVLDDEPFCVYCSGTNVHKMSCTPYKSGWLLADEPYPYP